MNWERAKTILIVMFLAVDVFLLTVLLQTRFAATRLSDSVIDETISILQAHHITAAKETVPAKRGKNQNIVMRNYFEEPQQIAQKMLGKCEVVQSDPQMHEYLYHTERKSLHVKGTNFTYTYHKNDVKPIDIDENSEKSEKALQKRVLDNLEKLGFHKKKMLICEGKNLNGLYECKVMPLYDEMKIYGVAMHLTMDNEDVVALEGVWFKVTSAEADEQEKLIDVTSVLAGLVFEETNDNIEITKIENAFYVADAYLENREIVAVPIYAIQKKSGAAEIDNEFLFFDARTGAAIQKDTAGAAEQSELPADNETTIETAEEGDGQNTPEPTAEQNDVQTENT